MLVLLLCLSLSLLVVDDLRWQVKSPDVFFWNCLRTHHKGKTVSERERERRNKHTSYRRSTWPGPPAVNNAERCPVRFPGASGRSARTPWREQCWQHSPGRSPGAPGDLHGTARQVTRCLLLEALENAPEGEDNEQERERERERYATNTHHIVDPLGQGHVP